MFAYRGAVLGGTLAVLKKIMDLTADVSLGVNEFPVGDEHAASPAPPPPRSTPATLTLPKHNNTTDKQINTDDFSISSLKRGQLVLEVDPVQRCRGVPARHSLPFGSLTW